MQGQLILQRTQLKRTTGLMLGQCRYTDSHARLSWLETCVCVAGSVQSCTPSITKTLAVLRTNNVSLKLPSNLRRGSPILIVLEIRLGRALIAGQSIQVLISFWRRTLRPPSNRGYHPSDSPPTTPGMYCLRCHFTSFEMSKDYILAVIYLHIGT